MPRQQLATSVKEYAFVILGSLIQALALRIFFIPANLASGGVSGVSQLINYYSGWPIGLMTFIGNVPLFLLGWKYLGGRQFAIRTAVSIVTLSFFTDFLVTLPFIPTNGITQDLVLNTLYGAVVAGIGYGLVYKGQGTSGGSDVLARILNHNKGIPITQSYLMTDTVVILGAGFIFGWEKALYAIITLYVSGLVVDTTLEGSGTVRTAMIITSQPQQVSDHILHQMDRGVTLLSGKGAFTGTERPVLYTVITRSEVQILKSLVQQADPAAFMVIGAAHEALGEGFKTFTKG